MAKNYQIGSFRYHGKRLRLAETAGNYAWAESGTIWLLPERQDRGNIFSSVGLSAESWTFTVRKQDLTMADAILWQGYHHFITSIDEPERGFCVVQTARVRIVSCQADMDEGGGISFPAAVTEKYVRHEQLLPQAENTTSLVLVTPKAVDLTEGSLVAVAGVPYEVQIGHRLDAWKNEFEIVRKSDL